MSNSLFREGGPYKIRKTAAHKYSMQIPIPPDADGRVARKCPEPDCSPGYFKVRLGTGIVECQKIAYCPYCRHGAEPSNFGTKEQLRYAKEVMICEAQEGIGRMIKDTLGFGPSGRKKIGGGLVSMELSYKQGPRLHVQRPLEEELLRAVVCPHCGLDHAVFGLAIWCPDCGRDIFMTHVKAECEVVRKILSDVNRRKMHLGARIAARDIENCLEDTVSIYEAVLKALLIRVLREKGMNEEEIHSILDKRIRNGFQNVDRATEIVKRELGVPLFVSVGSDVSERLKRTFEKRHPITHNLGVVDRKYLENELSAEQEGRDIRVTSDEILEALDITLDVLTDVHSRLFAQEDDNKNIELSNSQ
jgi:hypothetical protein